MNEINPDEAKAIIDSFNLHVGTGDRTHEPVYPQNRRDVCAIIRDARDIIETYVAFGFSHPFLVWKNEAGMHSDRLGLDEYLDELTIKEVSDVGEDIVVRMHSNGYFTGRPAGDRFYKVAKQDLGLDF